MPLSPTAPRQPLLGGGRRREIATKFGFVGALWTSVISFVIFYAVLPAWMMALIADRKATLNAPFATTIGNLLLGHVATLHFALPVGWCHHLAGVLGHHYSETC